MSKCSLTRGPAPRRQARDDRERPKAACRRSTSRPFVEVLEDRCLLSFITAPNYAAGINASSVVVGDFNGDGIPDLTVANAGSRTVTVLLGKGDGTFGAARSYTAGNGARSVAVGDFDGDGHLD